MKTGMISIAVFALMVLAQWYVPISMIKGQERIIEQGTSFKFKVAPIDPHDHFRGKYVWLNYDESSVKVTSDKDWPSESDFRNLQAYATIRLDSAGYATFDKLLLEKPSSGNYMRLQVNWFDNDQKLAYINIPFDRYYMEESKAPKAEKLYNKSFQNLQNARNPKEAWAVINILDGEGVLQALFIEGKSIEDWVQEME